MTPAEPLVDWTEENCRSYASGPCLARHRVHHSPLFTEAALIELIDRHPREKLQVFTMGQDPLQRSDWHPVDPGRSSGEEIWRAMQVGRLWVKLLRVDLAGPAYQQIVEELYDTIRAQCPGFESEWMRPLLLISSPNALVYYHADPNPTMLWQLSGRKRVWIYPVNDELLPPELMEQIFAGEVDEEAPYQERFDDQARVYDLAPGDVLSWPLNAPHRVVNHDCVNVSLSVPFGTEACEVRSQIYQTNLMLRRAFGISSPARAESGPGAAAKRFSYRVLRRLNLTSRLLRPRKPYVATRRIDASSSTGLSVIEGGGVRTAF